MPTFRIYYDDQTTFDSDDGPFEDAPSDGVICVVWRHGDITEFLAGADYYVRFSEDGSFVATGDIGPLLRRLCPWLKFGRYTSHRNHERIMNRAREDWKGK